MVAFNFIMNVVKSVFDLIFTVNLGGLSIGFIVGGMLVATLALKLLHIIIERS